MQLEGARQAMGGQRPSHARVVGGLAEELGFKQEVYALKVSLETTYKRDYKTRRQRDGREAAEVPRGGDGLRAQDDTRETERSGQTWEGWE